jgi:hypothetical protein
MRDLTVGVMKIATPLLNPTQKWLRVFKLIALLSLLVLAFYIVFFGWYRLSLFELTAVPASMADAPKNSRPLVLLSAHSLGHLQVGERSGAGCINSLNFYTIEAARRQQLISRFEKDTCALITSSPWFEDRNHAWPFGRGVINVLFATYVKGYGHFKYGFNDDVEKMSFENRKLLLKYSTKGLADGSSVHFWFQTKGSLGRTTNYYHTDAIPVVDDKLTTIEIDISNHRKYKCLGSIYRRVLTYGCDISPAEALKHVTVDYGLIRSVGTAYPRGQPNAEFVLHDFKIM